MATRYEPSDDALAVIMALYDLDDGLDESAWHTAMEIIDRSGISGERLNAALTELEHGSLIDSVANGEYRLNSNAGVYTQPEKGD